MTDEKTPKDFLPSRLEQYRSGLEQYRKKYLTMTEEEFKKWFEEDDSFYDVEEKKEG